MLYFWLLFNLFALGTLVVDLRLHRPGRAISFRAALGWSAMYIALAFVFAALLDFWQGHQAALEFVNPDELVEVTPVALRMRKRFLDHNERKRLEKARDAGLQGD